MGHKKRNAAPRSKPAEAEDAAAAAGAIDCGVSDLDQSAKLIANSFAINSDGIPSASYASIKLECERALTALRRGNHTKALRLMKDLCSKHENSPHSALIHRVQGTVCVKVASIIDDPNAKQRHLRNAIESARRAVVLSPRSIEFALFYANLLFESANDAKDFEEVVQECERALLIDNPVDPAKENLQDESQQKISTAEARVSYVQSELRKLIQRSSFSFMPNWVKSLTNGEEKFRFIPFRRAPEDPMELRLVQARRPNEIKKVTKTPEERRKDIELRVAAARIMQQKSEPPHSVNDGVKNSKDSGIRTGQRAWDRRKSGNMRKAASSYERMGWVESYWRNTLSSEGKKDLLTVKILDLRAHFSLSKDGTLSEMLSEAISFGEANNSWKFWTCCRCNEKFARSGILIKHVVQEHLGSLLPKIQSILPQNAEDEWVEMLLNCSWKPVELNAAIKMLEKQFKSDTHDLLDVSCCGHNADDSKECFLDSYSNGYEWVSSPRKKKSGEDCNGNKQDGRMFEDVVSMDSNDHQSSKGSSLFDWPLSDDSERTELLKSIHSLFQQLIKYKCLASSHLSKIIRFALEELQGITRGSQLASIVNQTPLCICFLGAPELTKIMKFLQEVSQSCGLNIYSDKTNSGDDLNSAVQGVDIMENIILRQNASFLVIDEQRLPCKIASLPFNDVSSAPMGFHIGYENGVILDSDALLYWIFTGASASDQLISWKNETAEKAQQGLEILQLLEKESYQLQGLCERKCEHLSYEEALQALEDLCLEEGKKSELLEGFVHQNYEYILKKRREELIENDSEIALINNRFELDAIENVLKDAESLNMNQFGLGEAYSGITSHPSDLESGEDDEWRAKDHLHQVDFCIEAAILRQKEQISTEISKIDARILRIVSGMQKLEVKLEVASSHDFRSILLPLVKSFVRALVEDLAEKDATKKSDAVREAFLAELARDSKKGGAIIDGSKQMHEKAKDRKKSRDNRKNKEQKATNGYNLVDQTDKEMLIPSEHEEEDAGLGNEFSGHNGTLQLYTEEYHQRIEFEAEERKLEETLEYQRRIENEAKQKHLAELHKRTLNTAKEKTELAGMLDSCCRHGDAAICVNQQTNWMGNIIDEGGLTNNIEVAASDDATEPLSRTGSPNEGVPQDGGFSFEQRPGRRGRRHKGPTKVVDGKCFPLKPDVENRELGPRYSMNSHGDGDNGENALKQHSAVEADDDRFQADLKKAVRQSLDGSNGKETYGTGLKNEVGEYNCFLNVIIQSLWHLRRFRDEFLRKSSSEHVHVGDPCVTCALYDIFIALSVASTDNRREAVAPTSLRVALSNLYPDNNFFQEGQMNDASEVLGVIFNCLHRSFASALDVSDMEPVDDRCRDPCIAHLIFGMDILERMNCYNCGLESRCLKYTSFFHNINASALRTMKVMYPENSLDELLNLVEMNYQLACDPESGGCGKLNYIHHILSSPPHVFTTVLGWQNTCETGEDIKATLVALSTEIDISVLYRGLDPMMKHRLVSVVCYYGQHYHCFAYSRDREQWMMYDDKTVKVIGGWNDVVAMCERGHLQPQVLLYEAVN